MNEGTQFRPALGCAEWTGFYDLAISIMTREGRWQRALVQQIGPRAREVILDVGCGTGTMVLALKQSAPGAQLIGLDPDEDVLARARSKAARRKLDIVFHKGFAHDAANIGVGDIDKVVSSLVFHQTPLEERRIGLAAMFEVLRPGGELHVADYGCSARH